MSMMNRLQEVQELIDKADIAYYTEGKSVMEDARYDKLKVELQQLNPTDSRLTTVGSKIRTNILATRKHSVPMGSLNKALNETEWNDWIRNNLTKNGVSGDLHASHKLDGGSFSAEYKDGRLVCFVSRGDGIEGEDITANAFSFKGVPSVVNLYKKPFTGFVRGEVVLTIDDWEKVDPNQESNPRNLAVGIARRKDGTQSEHLTFYAFRLFDVDGQPIGSTEQEMSLTLVTIGFNTSPFKIGSADDIWKWYEKIGKERQSLPYWIDGIVVKFNNIQTQLSLGESSNCPKGQVAIKFEAEGATTTLRAVTLQVGHTGAINPVAQFDPVRIGGTTVLNATLCNWENIETLGIQIGDEISVIKAGDIIPRIMEVTKKGAKRIPIDKPTHCPVCNGKAEHRANLSGEASTVIYCVNDQCPSIVSGKIEKYLKSLDIQTGGDSLIQALIKDLKVTEPSDLYLLHKKKLSLANLILSGKVRFGDKRAQKFIDEIESKRQLTLSDFLGSLGIFGLGKRRVQLIQDALPGKLDELSDWFTQTLANNAAAAGVKNMGARINADLIAQKDYIMKFIQNGVVITKPQPKAKLKDGAFIICITGALSKPKEHFKSLIEAAGHGYTDTFNKVVTHLVAADPTSGSSKLEKATKMGTKVISEAELIKLIGNVQVPTPVVTTPKTVAAAHDWFTD
jgi:DNA ligase (NAD+)